MSGGGRGHSPHPDELRQHWESSHFPPDFAWSGGVPDTLCPTLSQLSLCHLHPMTPRHRVLPCPHQIVTRLWVKGLPPNFCLPLLSIQSRLTSEAEASLQDSSVHRVGQGSVCWVQGSPICASPQFIPVWGDHSQIP